MAKRPPPRDGHRAPPRPGRPSERRPARRRGSFDDVLERHLRWLFPALLGLTALVVFWDFLSLQRLYLFKDIGSDTLNNFYPQRALTADILHGGAVPAWSFRQGLGQNVFPNALGDPFAWPLYLLGARALAYAIAPIEVVKVLLAGGLFYALLRLRQHRPFTAAVTAMGFAFCSTIVVGGGWWYLLSNQVVHLALLLVGYELMLRGRHAWLFPTAVALIAAFNPFDVYILGVPFVTYAAVRYLADRDPEPGPAARFAARVVGVMALGLAASAVFALPIALEMVQSPRVSGHSGLFGGLLQTPVFALGDIRLYATEILRSFGSDLTGPASRYRGWTNYLEAPSQYCGLLALLLAPQAFTTAHRRPRIAYGVVGGLLLLPWVFPWFRHALWLFSGDYFRTLSLMVSVALLLAAAAALDPLVRGRALNLPLLAGTLVVLLVLLHLPYGHGALAGEPGLRATVTAFLILEAGLIVLLARPGTRVIAQVALLTIVPIELAVTSAGALRDRSVVTGDEWRSPVGYHDGTLEALALIRGTDPGFFRVEKNYGSSNAGGTSLNDGKVQGYNGTSSYYSFNQLHYIGFLDALGVIDARDPVQTNWAPGLRSRFPLQTLTSVRYWLYRGDWRQVPMLAMTYDSIGAAADVTVLRNRSFVPFGFGLPQVLRTRAFRALDPDRRDMAVLRAAVIDDAAPAPAGLGELDTTSLRLPYALADYTQDARRCAMHTLAITRFQDGRIEGVAHSEVPRLWILGMPFDAGWSAHIDGRRAPLLEVDGGLTGLGLAAGDHRVRLDYEPPLRRIGSLLSALGVLGMLAVGRPWRGPGRLRPRTGVRTP